MIPSHAPIGGREFHYTRESSYYLLPAVEIFFVTLYWLLPENSPLIRH
jgi:hypothetical protein